MAQARYMLSRARTATPSDVLEAARPHFRLLGGLALTLAVLVVSLIVWGPEMEFPSPCPPRRSRPPTALIP